jgi:hypothetical protein
MNVFPCELAYVSTGLCKVNNTCISQAVSSLDTSGVNPTPCAVHSGFFPPSNKVLHTWSWPLISIHTDAKERRSTHQSPSRPWHFTLPSVHPAFCTCECSRLHPSLVTSTVNLVRHWPEMSGRNTTAGREASRDPIATIRGTSLYSLHTAPPLLYL